MLKGLCSTTDVYVIKVSWGRLCMYQHLCHVRVQIVLIAIHFLNWLRFSGIFALTFHHLDS